MLYFRRLINLFSFLPSHLTADVLTFHFACVQSSQVDPVGDSAGIQSSKSLSTSELDLVESSDVAMKVRYTVCF